jgi:hypothetical protein
VVIDLFRHRRSGQFCFYWIRRVVQKSCTCCIKLSTCHGFETTLGNISIRNFLSGSVICILPGFLIWDIASGFLENIYPYGKVHYWYTLAPRIFASGTCSRESFIIGIAPSCGVPPERRGGKVWASRDGAHAIGTSLSLRLHRQVHVTFWAWAFQRGAQRPDPALYEQ